MSAADRPTGHPPMLGRCLDAAAWQEYVATYDFGPLAPSRVVLHHTWRPTVAQWAGVRTMRGMQRFYASKGWDAGPHLFIATDGIWLFTPMADIGIHAGRGNGSLRAGWYSIGVEMVGNYDESPPDGVIWELTRLVLGSLSQRLDIAPRALISFHRDYSPKSCPGRAVGKEWVIAEVEAWLARRAAPPAPPPVAVAPPTDDEAYREALLEHAYRQRGEGYQSSWAFHDAALRHQLGMPLARRQAIQAAGRRIVFQPFARETLYAAVPDWGDAERLSTLLDGAIPPPGSLGRALLDALFATGGVRFEPQHPLHRAAALDLRCGPPLADARPVRSATGTYLVLPCACEALYAPADRPQQVARASTLRDPALRELLWREAYRAAGQPYLASDALQREARRHGLGVPLAPATLLAAAGRRVQLAVFAADALCIEGDGGIARLSALPASRPLLAAAAPAPAIAAIARAGPGASAWSPRFGARISAIVVHRRAVTLEQLLTPDARWSPHYLVCRDGAIIRLVDDALAAWHIGMVVWRARRRNLNRNSIGVLVEPSDAPNPAQQRAVAWLMRRLRRRYTLSAGDVIMVPPPDDHRDAAHLPVTHAKGLLP
jgi:N-acetyl-anhydromuramyl-L-alanine amidase AmpD